MAKNNLNELRKMDLLAIREDIKTKQILAIEEKMQLVMQGSQNLLSIRNLKKDIARLYTVKMEKEVLNG